MTREEFNELLDRYLDRKGSARERGLVEQFYEHFQQHEPGWEAFGEQRKHLIKTAIYQKFENQKQKREGQNQGSRSVWLGFPRMVGIAASLMIILGITFFFVDQVFRGDPEYVIVSTKRGEKSTYQLSDGSVVKLNSGSTLTFPKRFQDDRRVITLSGEAYFEVKRDESRPFTIQSGEISTTVLGTSFNINAYDHLGSISVTVSSGKVAVHHVPSGREEILEKGGHGVFDKSSERLSQTAVDVRRYLAWKDGVLRFDDEPLLSAIHKLSYWYNVHFDIGDAAFGTCVISGEYHQNTLRQILESFKYVNKIDYEFTDESNVVLSGIGCAEQ